MTGVITLTHWAIFRILHPRIWAPPTHFQKWWKISKSNSQGIRPKVWYPRNQRNSLNQLQVFEIEKSPTQKSYADFLSRNSTYLYSQYMGFIAYIMLTICRVSLHCRRCPRCVTREFLKILKNDWWSANPKRLFDKAIWLVGQNWSITWLTAVAWVKDKA